MSLKKITLPEILLADLYKNVLVLNEEFDGEKKSDGPRESETAGIKFLGNNLKNIFILVRHPSDVFLPERHLEFLTKILLACKLNIGDVAIINEGQEGLNINRLRKQLIANQVILFGIEPTQIKLPLNFPQFKLQSYANCTYLYVPSLDELNNDSEEGKLSKTKLWVCLKTMFEFGESK